ncbi:MAG: bifunctional precorrin-2 dehydrogenase/sirohydrochlorin ferrochelatase [Anaerolineae bacterium]
MAYYPVFLNLKDQRCVVVGGGVVAERKVLSLLEGDSQVTVISPELTPALQRLTAEGRIRHLPRRYRSGDLAGAALVIAATDQPQVNHQVWQEASQRGLLVNVVDDSVHCNFIVPAVVRQGDLTIAISTGGKSPALAHRLRERLEQTFGPEYARFLDLLGGLRERVMAAYPDDEERRAVWYRLVDSDLLELIRRREEGAVQELVEGLLASRPAEPEGSDR